MKIETASVIEIPRLITNKNMDYMLDGYKYVGMEKAIEKYITERNMNGGCFLYKKRHHNVTDKDYTKLLDRNANDIIGRVISYNINSMFVSITKMSYYESNKDSKIRINSLAEKDHEKKEIKINRIIDISL